MTLRLDPRVPLVWRTPTSLQLGGLDPIAVFPEVSHDEELLLHALRSGITRAGLDAIAAVRGMPAEATERMLDRVGPALVRTARPKAGAVVVGEGPLADGLAAALHGGGRGPRRERTELVVLVAPWLVSPRDAGHWLRRDIPHLPVVIGDGQVILGPLVRPGAGPCLHCRDLHRLDADPTWPAVAAQLMALPEPELPSLEAPDVLALAVQTVVAALERRLPPGRELRREHGSGAVSVVDRVPHPECSCQAPPGSDWAPAVARAPVPLALVPSAGGATSGPA